MLTILGVQISLAQVLSALPVIVKLLMEANALFAKLQRAGFLPDDARAQVLRIAGQQVLVHLGLPHAMTPAEEKIWMDRATSNVDNN